MIKRSRAQIALAATGALFAATCGGVALLEGSAWASQSTNSPAPATPRYGGADREATAIQIAAAHFSSGSQAAVAVLARDDSFADALAGNALAAQKKGPLMVTPTAGLDSGVAAELTKILPTHATVYLLGGTKALSDNVLNQVAALGFNPVRLWGNDRFETAVQIAGAISAHPHTVLVATGNNAPDALAAGAAAATDPNGGVVLLSDDSALPRSTAAYLSGVNPTGVSVYGVGGQGVNALNSLAGFRGHFTPFAGSDRFDTDAKVASNPVLFPNPTSAGLATGVDGHWPDALAGGAFVGLTRSPLLLADSDSIAPQVAAWLHGHGGALTTISVFGGRVVVPDAVVAQAVGYATGTTPVPSPSPTPTPTVVPPTPALVSNMKTHAANTNVVVTFDASKSKAGGTSTIKSYTFNFGDGTAPVTQTTPVIAHAFSKTGLFSVSVTVADADNATAVANIPFFVSNPVPQPPTGNAAGTPIAGTSLLIWAGIYDDHHSGGTTGTKPGPWCNGAVPPPPVAGGLALGQTTFEGSADDGTMCGTGWDTPGIRIKNNGTTNATVNLTSVTIGATAQNLQPGSPNQTAGNNGGDWGGHWTAVTLAPGQEVIFAQWYDSGLSGSHKANTFDPGDTNNAGDYQNAADPGLCGFPSPAKASIVISLNGSNLPTGPLTDRFQILNEHGVDAAGCPDNFPGRNDESTQWAGL